MKIYAPNNDSAENTVNKNKCPFTFYFVTKTHQGYHPQNIHNTPVYFPYFWSFNPNNQSKQRITVCLSKHDTVCLLFCTALCSSLLRPDQQKSLHYNMRWFMAYRVQHPTFCESSTKEWKHVNPIWHYRDEHDSENQIRQGWTFLKGRLDFRACSRTVFLNRHPEDP